MAAAFEGLSKEFLCLPAGVHVRRVEHRHAGIETDVDETSGARRIVSAECLEELVVAAERRGAKTEDRDLEPRSAKLPIVHQFSKMTVSGSSSPVMSGVGPVRPHRSLRTPRRHSPACAHYNDGEYASTVPRDRTAEMLVISLDA